MNLRPAFTTLGTMTWHCCDCHQNFPGPLDRTPEDGCAHCHSRNVFDCNLESVDPATEAAVIAALLQGEAEIILP